MEAPRPSPSRSETQGDETTPLLASGRESEEYGSSAAGESPTASNTKTSTPARDQTPLPLKQIAVLSFVRMSSPMAFNQVQPYINKMVERIGVTDDPKEVGYYSGVLQSVFAFVQAFTILKTGMLADQFGRKPIIMLSLLGITLSTLLFGLATTFWLAVMARTLAGVLGGNAMLINSAVGDITDDTNQAQAFAIIGLSFNAASIIAPLVGGSLAEPEETFPDTLGRIRFLQDFPYFLPCAASALFVFLSYVAGFLFMKETNVHRPVLKKTASFYSREDINEDVIEAKRASAWKIAFDPVLFSVLRIVFILNALNSAASSVFSLFAYTPVKNGGLSRNPAEIGEIIASSGIIIALLEVLCISQLQRHFGTLKLLQWSMALWPFCFALFPIVNVIAKATMAVNDTNHVSMQNTPRQVTETEPASVAVWAAVLVLLVVQRIAMMAYPLCLMLTKNAAPSKEVLGIVFGLSHFMGCISRAIAPAFISSLFAFSKENAVMGGNFVWIVMIILSCLGFLMSCSVRDGLVERAEAQSDEE